MVASRILALRQETSDTVTLRVYAPGLAFVPGQFIMLGAPLLADGRELRRSYSVSGVGFDRETTRSEDYGLPFVEATIKEQPGGNFSVYARTLAVGDSIALYGPFGKHFIFDPKAMAASHQMTSLPLTVFIAGGSGIAPFRFMLETARAQGYRGEFIVLYSVKTRADIIFHTDFARWAAELRCASTITLTRPTEQDAVEWKGLFGRFGPKQIQNALGSHERLVGAHYYLCGPTPMVVDIQNTLVGLGVTRERIKTEKFGAIDG